MNLLFLLLQITNIITEPINLVKNPSFEEYTVCPIKNGQIELSKSWHIANYLASPDYFHECQNEEKSDITIPTNFCGVQKPKSGRAYAGIFVYRISWDNNRTIKNVREFVCGCLDVPLKKGMLYKVQIYISLSDNSDYALKTLGFYFTEDLIHNYDTDSVFALNYTEIIIPDSTVFCKDRWVKLNGSYQANGKERYIIIGNFKTDDDLEILDLSLFPEYMSTKFEISPYSYYYIDDVGVFIDNNLNAQDQTFSLVSNNNSSINLQKEKTISVEDIFFEEDKIELLPESINNLSSIIEFLNQHIQTKIEIRGHTDNIGTEIHNMGLSINRAKAVYDYLISVCP